MKTIKLSLVIFAFITLPLIQSCKNQVPSSLSPSSAPGVTFKGMYPIELPGNGSLDMVTRIDLRNSMEMAAVNLIANNDSTNNYLPTWSAELRMDDSVEVHRSYFSHNLGRWWDAMLRLESATGYHIPGNVEAAMLENLKRYFDNPDHFCLGPLSSPNEKRWMDMHSLREGMLALNALVRYRNDPWAREMGHSMCLSLLRMTRDDGTWIIEQFAQNYRDTAAIASYPKIRSDGRLIEALVWFYEATGDPEAMRAADRFARYHLKNTTAPDGSMVPQPSSHTHSYFGTLRGLLLFGELTDQREYVDVVALTYEKTIKALLKKSGFISHNLANDSIGETTSPGDAAQIALWLATRHGRTEYFDDIERIVRARLIPCQITEVKGLKVPEDAPLLLGATGGMYKEAHGYKMATTDITAAVIHTLVDIYQNIVTSDDAGLRINLHFNYEDKKVRIASLREKSARLTVLPKEKQNVLIRIPRWTPWDSVQITVDGKPYQPLVLGDYVFVPRDLTPAEIVVSYALPVSTQIEPTGEINYEITWRGDEVMGIWPNSSHLPFYPDFAPLKKQ